MIEIMTVSALSGSLAHLCRRLGRVVALCALLVVAAVPTALAGPERPLSKQEEAAALSVAAKGRADMGDYAIAAELYEQAARIDPAEKGYLYSAARCLHKATKWSAAEALYKKFLELAGAEHPMSAKALGYLDEVRKIQADQQAQSRALQELRDEKQKLAAEREKLEKARAAADAAKNAAIVKKAPDSGAATTPMAAYSVAGAGVAAVAVGAWLLNVGLNDAQTLSDQLDEKVGGKITGTDRDDALKLRSTALAEQWAGGALVGAGVLGVAAGLWMALDAKPPKVSLAPAVGGLSLAYRF